MHPLPNVMPLVEGTEIKRGTKKRKQSMQYNICLDVILESKLAPENFTKKSNLDLSKDSMVPAGFERHAMPVRIQKPYKVNPTYVPSMISMAHPLFCRTKIK